MRRRAFRAALSSAVAAWALAAAAVQIVASISATTLLLVLTHAAFSHDIYTGVFGKQRWPCCGGNDCAATIYRESGGRFEFLTRENEWIEIPVAHITFLPIAGDDPAIRPVSDESHRAHLCYFQPYAFDSNHVPDIGALFSNGRETIYLLCAFIPPGGG
jgi:hypothetical protein